MRDWAGQLGMPAVAGGLAVCFTHPLELTKVRLQLDNERAAAGTPRIYKGWIDCVARNYASDGIYGLQRGLSLGITREVCFNAIRIGLVEPVLDAVHTGAAMAGMVKLEDAPGPERLASYWTRGALGGTESVEVIATRMQACVSWGFSTPTGPVALLNLVRSEGLSGCFNGVATSTLRGIVGPGTQIFAYNEFKREAGQRGMDSGAASTHVVCAVASAAVSTCCVNPVDVTRTRLYNAPPGRYKGGVDAAIQLVKFEGPLAFYKGALTHFFRLGPHMVLVFTFLEQFKQLRSRWSQSGSGR